MGILYWKFKACIASKLRKKRRWTFWRFILDVNTFKRMDRKAQTDNMLVDVVRKEFTQSMAKNDAETRQDHLCTRSLETRTNDVMHVTTYVLVTCFYSHTPSWSQICIVHMCGLVKSRCCVYHVVILSMVVVAFAASVESSLLSSSLLEPRRDRGNRKEMVCFLLLLLEKGRTQTLERQVDK